MYAVIVTGGKQYRVAEGEKLKIEKLELDAGANVTFDQVLMVANKDCQIQIGKPYLSSAKVTAEVIKQGRGKKVRIVKMRRRKNSRRQAGHRQSFTEVKITGISA